MRSNAIHWCVNSIINNFSYGDLTVNCLYSIDIPLLIIVLHYNKQVTYRHWNAFLLHICICFKINNSDRSITLRI